MKPHKVSFYVYAENEQQIQDLQCVLNGFVRAQYNKGIVVSAQKLAQALQTFGNNFFVTNFLKR